MTDLTDLTMHLLTRNRPRMLEDSLNLYCASDVEFGIVVHDGSNEAIKERNRAAAERHAGRVEYVAYPFEMKGTQKFRLAAQSARTPFNMFAAEDDLFVPEALRAGVEFLRSHPDYSACHGTNLSARLSDPANLQLKVWQAVVSLDSPTVLGRLLMVFSRFAAMFYAIHRRDAFAASFDVPEPVGAGHFYELYQAAVALAMGKLHALQTPYVVKNFEPGENNTFYTVHPTGELLAGIPNFTTFYPAFREALTRALQGYDPNPEWPHLVDVLYASYFSRAFQLAEVMKDFETKGLLSPDEIRQAVIALDVPHQGAIPPPVIEFVKPFLARGWPAYG